MKAMLCRPGRRKGEEERGSATAARLGKDKERFGRTELLGPKTDSIGFYRAVHVGTCLHTYREGVHWALRREPEGLYWAVVVALRGSM